MNNEFYEIGETLPGFRSWTQICEAEDLVLLVREWHALTQVGKDIVAIYLTDSGKPVCSIYAFRPDIQPDPMVNVVTELSHSRWEQIKSWILSSGLLDLHGQQPSASTLHVEDLIVIRLGGSESSFVVPGGRLKHASGTALYKLLLDDPGRLTTIYREKQI